MLIWVCFSISLLLNWDLEKGWQSRSPSPISCLNLFSLEVTSAYFSKVDCPPMITGFPVGSLSWRTVWLTGVTGCWEISKEAWVIDWGYLCLHVGSGWENDAYGGHSQGPVRSSPAAVLPPGWRAASSFKLPKQKDPGEHFPLSWARWDGCSDLFKGRRRWSIPDLLHVTLCLMQLGPQHLEGPPWPGATFTSPWNNGRVEGRHRIEWVCPWGESG